MRKRPEVLVAIAVGAILLLAIVAVFTSRGTTSYGSGTPERVLQSYLNAVVEGDKLSAFSYIAEDSPCTQQDMDNSYVVDISRIDMISSLTTGNTARIRVKLEYNNDFPFGASGYGEEHTFSLVKQSGEWKITDGAWPMYSCGEWVNK